MLGGLRQTSFTDELGLPQPAWTSLPTTKMKRPNRADAFAWCYSYTGFSLAFARAAIAQLGVQAGSSVVDPFVGSGTTLVAAALAGCSALGVDINPFSTLLSRARLATKADIGRVLDYLKTRTRKHIRECGEQVLHPRDQVYVDAVAAKIFDYHKLEPRRFWTALLEDDVGRFDSEAVVILSLALGARDSARLVRGSNPIWYRKTSDGRDADASDLKAAAIRWGTSIVRDLVSASSIDRNGIKIINTDFNSDQLTGAFDFCLTSPPYLNRLDYVVAHLPELAVLQLITSVDIERLRSAMIGTTKIVAKDESPVPVDWGPTCLQTLSKIWDHKAYASRRYYYHTYRQYFAGLYCSFEKVTELLRTRSHGALVIQNSFYKDVNVPTPIIASEMLQALGWRSEIVRTALVKVHMGRMSPKQTAYAPHKTLGESIVHFSR